MRRKRGPTWEGVVRGYRQPRQAPSKVGTECNFLPQLPWNRVGVEAEENIHRLDRTPRGFGGSSWLAKQPTAASTARCVPLRCQRKTKPAWHQQSGVRKVSAAANAKNLCTRPARHVRIWQASVDPIVSAQLNAADTNEEPMRELQMQLTLSIAKLRRTKEDLRKEKERQGQQCSDPFGSLLA